MEHTPSFVLVDVEDDVVWDASDNVEELLEGAATMRAEGLATGTTFKLAIYRLEAILEL